MDEQLITALEECLAAVRAGNAPEDCIDQYPDIAAELGPFLHIALALEYLPSPGPSAGTMLAAEESFLAEAERRRMRPASSTGQLLSAIAAAWSRVTKWLSTSTWASPVRSAAWAAVMLTVTVLIGRGIISAASGSHS